jgi:hypothetical protein
MAIVNNEHSITKSGIGIGQPILVQGGIDGNYAVLAHQIDWGKSLFNNKEFGRNTQDLLNEIEEMLSNVQCNSSNKAVDNWGVFSVPTFPEMPTSETPYPTVTVTPTHTPTVTVTVTPTHTPTPTVSPTVSPTVTVTVSPTVTMTTSPTT